MALAAMLLVSGGACGDDSPGSAGAAAAEARAASTRGGEASTDQLGKTLGALLDAVRANNADETNRLTQGLALPAASGWFETTFGSARGAKLYREYQPALGQLGQLGGLLEGLIDGEQTQIRVEVFDSPGAQEATGYQNLALAAMKKRTPLYSARFTKAGEATGFHVWSFVHHKGAFRWVGKMKTIYSGEPAAPDLLELRARLASQAGSFNP